MNLDLLKKLTKLANHNPNENESNLAARKVCKMLEECDWNLNNTKEQPNLGQDFGDSIDIEKIMRDINNFHKTQARKPPPPKYNPPKPPESAYQIVTCKRCKRTMRVAFVSAPDDFVCNYCYNIFAEVKWKGFNW